MSILFTVLRPTCIILYDNFIIKIRLFFHSLFMYLNCTDNKGHDWGLWRITWWPLHDACYFFRNTEKSLTPSNQSPKHQSPTSKTPNRKTPNRKISKQKNLQTEKHQRWVSVHGWPVTNSLLVLVIDWTPFHKQTIMYNIIIIQNNLNWLGQ